MTAGNPRLGWNPLALWGSEVLTNGPSGTIWHSGQGELMCVGRVGDCRMRFRWTSLWLLGKVGRPRLPTEEKLMSITKNQPDRSSEVRLNECCLIISSFSWLILQFFFLLLLLFAAVASTAGLFVLLVLDHAGQMLQQASDGHREGSWTVRAQPLLSATKHLMCRITVKKSNLKPYIINLNGFVWFLV